MKKNGRGGARVGAGAKPKGHVELKAYVLPQILKQVDECRGEQTRGEWLSRAVQSRRALERDAERVYPAIRWHALNLARERNQPVSVWYADPLGTIGVAQYSPTPLESSGWCFGTALPDGRWIPN